MSTILTRSTADLEVRSTSERIIAGYAVPYNSPALIRGEGSPFEEQIVKGAFARTIDERGHKVRLLVNHDRRSLPLGRAVLLEEHQQGLYAEFVVSRTQAGDELLELVSTDVVDSFSVGMIVRDDVWSARRDKRTIREASLSEVSAVGFPAYEKATITGTRATGTRTISPEQAARRLRLLDTYR